MTVLCDYEIVFKGEQKLGDNGLQVTFSSNFSAGGALSNAFGLLTFMVRGLNIAARDILKQAQLPTIKLNGTQIGTLAPVYEGGLDDLGLHTRSWYAQHLVFSTNLLKDPINGNVLQISTAQINEGGEPFGAGTYDDFAVRDIVCFFRQNS